MTALLLNAPQQMFVTRVLGDEHCKQMPRVTEGIVTVQLPWVPRIRFLLVCGFSSHSRICHSYGDVTISSEGLHILIYIYSALIVIESSEGSLACHFDGASVYNYCYLRGPVTLTAVAKRLAVELSISVLTT